MSKFLEMSASRGDVTTFFHVDENGRALRAYRRSADAPKTWTKERPDSIFSYAPAKQVSSLMSTLRKFISRPDIMDYEAHTGRKWEVTLKRGRPSKGAPKSEPKVKEAPVDDPRKLVYSSRRDELTAALEGRGFTCQEKKRNSPRWQPPAKHEYRRKNGSVIVWWECPGQPGEYIREVWCRHVDMQTVSDLLPPKTKIQHL